jgi:hypothetical protein
VGRPRDESRAIEEIQALSQFLKQLVELNQRLVATLIEVQQPIETPSEVPEIPPDDEPPG